MKKVVALVTVISVCASMAFAELTQKQLNKYMDVSGSNVMLENMQSQMSDMIDMQMKSLGKNIGAKDAIKVTEALTSDKNIGKITAGLKNMDVKIYKDIISFYASKVGKKSSDIAKSMDITTMEKDMAEFVKSQKENPFSAKKTELISKILKVTNSVDLQIKMVEGMLLSVDEVMESVLPKSELMPKKEKEIMMSQMKSMMKEQIETSINFTYKDFTEKELSELLTYAKSKAGKVEMDIVMNGMVEYAKSAMKDAMNSLMMELKEKHPETLKKAA